MRARAVLVVYLSFAAAALAVVVVGAMQQQPTSEATTSQLVRALDSNDIERIRYYRDRGTFEWVDQDQRFEATVPAHLTAELTRRPEVVTVTDSSPSVGSLIAMAGSFTLLAAPLAIQLGLAAEAVREPDVHTATKAAWAVGLIGIPVIVPAIYLLRRDHIPLKPLVPIAAGLITVGAVAGIAFGVENPNTLRVTDTSVPTKLP